MKVVLSPFAEAEFEKIVKYFAENVSPKMAENIFNGISDSLIQLSKYPNIGVVEQSLLQHNRNHRYIVS